MATEIKDPPTLGGQINQFGQTLRSNAIGHLADLKPLLIHQQIPIANSLI
jgi:hypothetical protein